MAGRNSPFGSVSSILKGASSTATKVAEYNDAIAAYEYANSAHTDDAFSAYQAYLRTRIDGLKGGDLASQQKALSLTNTLESAYHSNISAGIQRANIQIMSGGGTLTDKYNLLSGQYGQAVANGDYTLAQSLMSQAYSVSQQIQYDQQQAATAADSLSKATASAGARSESDLAQSLKDKLDQFNVDYTHAGQKTADKMLGDFVKANKDTFSALGINLQDGIQPNYFDVVDGVNRAIYKAYTLAGDAVAPFAADGGQSYYDKASALVDKIPTIYGNMNAQQLLDAANNPSQFSYNTAPDYKAQGAGGTTGKLNPQVGYRFTSDGGVAAVTSNTPWVDIPNNFKTQIDQLGLNVVGQAKDGGEAYTVHATDKSPDFIKKLLPANATTVVTANSQSLGAPGIQFEADAQNGTGKAVYSVTYDQNGRKAIFESSNTGDKLLTSDPGYDKTFAPNAHDYIQPQAHDSFWSNAGNILKSGLSNVGSMFGGGGINQPSSLINNAQSLQKQQAEDAAAQALLAKPLQLPSISIASPPPLPPLAVSQPKPLPNLTVAKPTPLPVNQQTVTPQPATQLSVQGGSVGLQGGGVRLQ